MSLDAYLWAVCLAAFVMAMIALVIAFSAYELASRPPAGGARDKAGRFRKIP